MEPEEEDIKKPITMDLIGVSKNEDKSEDKLEKKIFVKSVPHEDIKVVKEEVCKGANEEEGRPESVKLLDQEKLEVKGNKDCLVSTIKSDGTESSLLSNKDGALSDSSDVCCRSKVLETSIIDSKLHFHLIVDNSTEYITPDTTDLTPENSIKSAPSAKLNLDSKKLALPIKSVRDTNNGPAGDLGSKGVDFVVNLSTNTSELIKEYFPKGNKNHLSDVSKRMQMNLNERPKLRSKVSIVKNKQKISDKSSSVSDESNSGSDWEQEYLASKSTELKRNPSTKKLSETRLAEKRRRNVASLKSSDQVAEKSNESVKKSIHKPVVNLTKQMDSQSLGKTQMFLLVIPPNYSEPKPTSEGQQSAFDVFRAVASKTSSNALLPKEPDSVVLESKKSNDKISSQNSNQMPDFGSVRQSVQAKLIQNKKPNIFNSSANGDKAAKENNDLKVLPKGDLQAAKGSIYEQLILKEPKEQNALDESSFSFSTPACECKKCKRMYNSKKDLSAHLKNSTCGDYKRKANLQCDTCGQLFKDRRLLIEHLNIHNNVRPFKCPACDKRFARKFLQISHYRNIHLNIKKSLFLCCYCSMTTKSKSHLLAHEETHRLPEGATVEMPFKCGKCGRGYISKFKLKIHLAEHNPFKCKMCNHKYKSAEVLEKHVKSVHRIGEKFKCDICGKVFDRSHALNVHKKNVHESYVRFFCDICGKGFKQKHLIEQHMITHSDMRPISCSQCDGTFKRKTHLKQHIAAFH